MAEVAEVKETGYEIDIKRSPFREIPTLATLTEEQMCYAQAVAGELVKNFWSVFESRQSPYKRKPPEIINLETPYSLLNKNPIVTIYRHVQGY